MDFLEDQFTIAIIENDGMFEPLVVWEYPDISLDYEYIYKNYSKIRNVDSIYLKFKDRWVYALNLKPINNISSKLFISCRAFHPEKFLALLSMFSSQYNHSRNPTNILECYLSLCANGTFSNGIKSINLGAYSNDIGSKVVDALDNVIKDLISNLGEDVVVLWNAVILKKRIIVYAKTIPVVLSIVSSLSLFASHRPDPFAILRPLVQFDTDKNIQLQELRTLPCFIAGTFESCHKDLLANCLCDVLLTVNDDSENKYTITVHPHAREAFRMGQLHKDMAAYMVQLALTNTRITEQIKQKTLKIIKSIQSLPTIEAAINETDTMKR